MFGFEACEVLKYNKFTVVNVCFQYKRNEEIGHYRQTLINKHMQLYNTKQIVKQFIAPDYFNGESSSFARPLYICLLNQVGKNLLIKAINLP